MTGDYFDRKLSRGMKIGDRIYIGGRVNQYGVVEDIAECHMRGGGDCEFCPGEVTVKLDSGKEYLIDCPDYDEGYVFKIERGEDWVEEWS